MTRDLGSETDIDFALARLKQHILKRLEKHGKGKFINAQEATGVLVEEYHETIDALRSNNLEHFLSEMTDIAVTCVWADISLRQ